MATNDEFGLDEATPQEVPIKKPGKKAKAKADEVVAAVAAPMVDEVEIDPEDDRENWPVIRIEDEQDKPNFEFIGAHGTRRDGSPFSHELRIMRNVDVAVPPSAVNTLKDAVATHIHYGRDAQGNPIQVRSDRSSIPWRLVKPGKYFS